MSTTPSERHNQRSREKREDVYRTLTSPGWKILMQDLEAEKSRLELSLATIDLVADQARAIQNQGELRYINMILARAQEWHDKIIRHGEAS